MFMLTVQQKGKNGQAKMHFFSEMTEFRLGKSSWRNSVREENAPAIVRALVSCVRQVSASLQHPTSIAAAAAVCGSASRSCY